MRVHTEIKLSADLNNMVEKKEGKSLVSEANRSDEIEILVCSHLATAENSTDGRPFSTDPLPWECILLSAIIITLFLFIEITINKQNERDRETMN